MDIYAKGQLSFLILNCLLDRDFYGLDIISEVKDRSNGRIELKKPSVYSNLTRMEKQGQVSSYMRSSDVGPNRRYYSITEKGRNTYQSLKEEFERNHFDVFRDYVDDDKVVEDKPIKEEVFTASQPVAENKVEQDDFFDFSSVSENEKTTVQEETITQETIAVVKEENNQQSTVEENIISPIAIQPQEEIKQEETIKIEESSEPVKDDASFLQKEDFNDPSYNQRIYDITKDFNKYRKKRSFAEDQMSIVESDETLREAETKHQERLDDLKSALLESKGKFDERMTEKEFYRTTTPIEEKSAIEEIQEEKPDDGKFITEHTTTGEQFRTKKIEPPRLKINAANPLPAPNRDASIDPSHKEIISKLYAKSKGSSDEQINTKQVARNDSIYDYDDLMDYYKEQRISFRPYVQQSARPKHNTNKLSLITSLITFSLLCVLSGIMYAILNACGYTNITTNFLYIVLPALFLIDVAFKVASLKYTSWEPKQPFPQWLIWILYALGVGIIFGLNFIFGMSGNTILHFSTPLFLPIVLLFVVLPIRYYIKRWMIVKFWK